MLIHDIVFLILGLVLLIGGADFVTDGAVAIARRFKVSNLMIGLTVVALGSSMPDIVVCIESALEHKTAISVGEVVGANIFDLLLVTGLMGAIRPWRVGNLMLKQDLPILAIASISLWIAADTVIFDGGSGNVLDRSSGLLLLVVFAFYMWLMVITSKSQKIPSSGERPATGNPAKGVVAAASADHGIASSHSMAAEWKILKSKLTSHQTGHLISWGMVAAGLAGLVTGGSWVVTSASALAAKAGMSQGLVALTIVAIGNSLPDLATSITATMKGASGIAFGNIVGACIINALLALGLSALITPLGADSIGTVDFLTLAGASLLLCLIPRLSHDGAISRFWGVGLIALFAAYMTYTIIGR